MIVPQSKKLALIDRRQQVADLYLQGWTQVAIGEHLGVAQPTICDDLKHIRHEWRESTIRDFDAARDLELRKLDRVEREAWAAWERSQKPIQSAVVNGDGAGQPARKSMKSRHGDLRALEIILKCGTSRRAMLGLDAPVQIAPVTPDGQEPYRLAVESMSVIELRALARVRERMLTVTSEQGPADDPSSEADDRVD